MNILCPKCKQELLKLGQPLQQFYEDILILNCHGASLIFDENICDSSTKTISKYLESKGMIITTEVAESKISMIINHKNLFYNLDFDQFCFNENDDHFIPQNQRKKKHQ